MAEPRRNGHIGKVLELGVLHFHAVMAAKCNAIDVLEQFCRIAIEIEIATESAFYSMTTIEFMPSDQIWVVF